MSPVTKAPKLGRTDAVIGRVLIGGPRTFAQVRLYSDLSFSGLRHAIGRMQAAGVSAKDADGLHVLTPLGVAAMARHDEARAARLAS